MGKIVRREPMVIPGFEAIFADADFYKTVAEGTVKKFGKDSRAYKRIMNGINPENATGSNFLFNTEAGLYIPEGKRVGRVDDFGDILDTDPGFFNGIYSDSSELVLRTATLSWANNAQVLENLVKQARQRGLDFSPEDPLVLSDLELVKNNDGNNYYGVLFKITDKTQTRNDSRFDHRKKTIQLRNQTKTLWTKQTGLSRAYLNRYDLNSNDDDLENSYDDGRVVVFDAKGVAPNFSFEKYVAQIQEAYKEKIARGQEIVRTAMSDLEKL